MEYVTVHRISGLAAQLPDELVLHDDGDVLITLTSEDKLLRLIHKKQSLAERVLSASLGGSAPSTKAAPKPGVFLVYRELVTTEFRCTEAVERDGVFVAIALDEPPPPKHRRIVDATLGALASALDAEDTRIAPGSHALFDLTHKPSPLIILKFSVGAVDAYVSRPLTSEEFDRAAPLASALAARPHLHLPTRLLGGAERTSDDPEVRFILAWGAVETLIRAVYKEDYKSGIEEHAEPRFIKLRGLISAAYDRAESRGDDLPPAAKLRVIVSDLCVPELAEKLVQDFAGLAKIRNQGLHQGRADLLPLHERELRRFARQLFRAVSNSGG